PPAGRVPFVLAGGPPEAEVVRERPRPGGVLGQWGQRGHAVPGAEEALEEGAALPGQLVGAAAARPLGLLVLPARVLPVRAAPPPGRRPRRAAPPAGAAGPPPAAARPGRSAPPASAGGSSCCAGGPSRRRRASRPRAGAAPAAAGPPPGSASAGRPPRRRPG